MRADNSELRDEIPYISPYAPVERRSSKIYAALYILCVILGCLGDWSRLASSSVGAYMKAASLGSVALALLVFVRWGRIRGLKEIGKFSLVFIAPLLIALLFSLVIWVVNTESLSAISRGSQKLIFQVINIFSVLAAAYLFREKVILYFMIGLLGGNALICMLEIPHYGLGGAIKSVFDGLTGGDAYGFMSAIEIHDITFAAGVLTMYYLTAGFHEKRARLCALASVFFFVIGFKRIALPGCALCVVVWWLLDKRRLKTRERAIKIISVMIPLIAFGYVIFVKQGLFTQIMHQMGVDMLGRDRIYAYIEQFYTIDPTYIGYGFEYTVAMLRGMREAGDEVVHVTAIHNDVLKLYIELGFWGFFAWMYYVYVFQTRWYLKHYGERAARLMLIVNLYSFITYLTDNTTYYFWFSMTMRVVMIGFAQSASVVAALKKEHIETGLLSREDAKALAGDGDDRAG